MLQVITRESDDILMKAQTRGDVEKTHSVDDTMHLIQVSKDFTIPYHSSARPESEIWTLNGPFIQYKGVSHIYKMREIVCYRTITKDFL